MATFVFENKEEMNKFIDDKMSISDENKENLKEYGNCVAECTECGSNGADGSIYIKGNAITTSIVRSICRECRRKYNSLFHRFIRWLCGF